MGEHTNHKNSQKGDGRLGWSGIERRAGWPGAGPPAGAAKPTNESGSIPVPGHPCGARGDARTPSISFYRQRQIVATDILDVVLFVVSVVLIMASIVVITIWSGGRL